MSGQTPDFFLVLLSVFTRVIVGQFYKTRDLNHHVFTFPFDFHFAFPLVETDYILD